MDSPTQAGCAGTPPSRLTEMEYPSSAQWMLKNEKSPGGMRGARRLLTAHMTRKDRAFSRRVFFGTLAVALVGCGTSSAETSQFCEVATPMFERNSVPQPNVLSQQVSEIIEAAESHLGGTGAILVGETEALVNDLDAASRGEAENGWNSVPVMEEVQRLCDRNDLIGWVVQP